MENQQPDSLDELFSGNQQEQQDQDVDVQYDQSQHNTFESSPDGVMQLNTDGAIVIQPDISNVPVTELGSDDSLDKIMKNVNDTVQQLSPQTIATFSTANKPQKLKKRSTMQNGEEVAAEIQKELADSSKPKKLARKARPSSIIYPSSNSKQNTQNFNDVKISALIEQDKPEELESLGKIENNLRKSLQSLDKLNEPKYIQSPQYETMSKIEGNNTNQQQTINVNMKDGNSTIRSVRKQRSSNVSNFDTIPILSDSGTVAQKSPVISKNHHAQSPLSKYTTAESDTVSIQSQERQDLRNTHHTDVIQDDYQQPKSMNRNSLPGGSQQGKQVESDSLPKQKRASEQRRLGKIARKSDVKKNTEKPETILSSISRIANIAKQNLMDEGGSSNQSIYARRAAMLEAKSGKIKKAKKGSNQVIDSVNDIQEERFNDSDSDYNYYSYASDEEERRKEQDKFENYEFYLTDEDDSNETGAQRHDMRQIPELEDDSPYDLNLSNAGIQKNHKSYQKKLLQANIAALQSDNCLDLEGKQIDKDEIKVRKKASKGLGLLNEKPLDPRRVKGIRKGLELRRRRKAGDQGVQLNIARGIDDRDNEYLIQRAKEIEEDGYLGYDDKMREVDAQHKGPKALYDPKVRKQLEKMKTHKPFFTYAIIFINFLVLAYEFYFSQTTVGQLIDTGAGTFNYMIGPSSAVLIATGARFIPCMKVTQFTGAVLNCTAGFKSSVVNATAQDGFIPCTLEDFCGITGFSDDSKPDQWWRLFTAIFLHGGIVHFVLNSLMLYQTGIAMEEAYGSIRIAIIYFVSGVAGFAFGGNLQLAVPTVGASGSIFGILAVVLLDLLLNFKIVQNRWKELFKLMIQVIFSLAFGLLPLVDNFAHVGGFITGLISGLLLMPALTFSAVDKAVKITLRILSFPVLIAVVGYVVYDLFYQSGSQCSWCKYLDCIPVNGWCDGYSS